MWGHTPGLTGWQDMMHKVTKAEVIHCFPEKTLTAEILHAQVCGLVSEGLSIQSRIRKGRLSYSSTAKCS